MFKRTLSAVLCAMLMLGLLPFFTPAARMAPTTVNIVVDKTTAYVGDTLTYSLNAESPEPFQTRITVKVGAIDVYSGGFGNLNDETPKISYVVDRAGSHVATAIVKDLTDDANLASDSISTLVKLRAAPKITSVSAVSSTAVKITWTAVSGVTGYQVYYATNSAGPYNKSGTSTGLSYTKTYLTPGTRYYFKVAGYNLVRGAKCESTNQSSYKAGVALGKSTISSITSPSKGRVTLTWAKVAGLTGYQVLRATSSGGTYSVVKSTGLLTFTNTGLTSGKTYYYKIRPYKTYGTTKYYGVLSAYKSIRVK